MRCRLCHADIVAVDLMPRIIAMTGTLDDNDFDPESLDKDEYEVSVTVGYGCVNLECANWYGNVGNVVQDEGGDEYTIEHQNTLDDVAEDTEEDTDEA